MRDSVDDDVIAYSRHFYGYKWSNIYVNKLRREPYWRNSQVLEYYGKKSLTCIMDLNEWIRIFYEYHGVDLSEDEIDTIAKKIAEEDESVYIEFYDMFDSDSYRDYTDYAEKAYSVFLNRSDAEVKGDRDAISGWSGHIAQGEEYRRNFIKTLMQSDEFKYKFALDD